MGLVIPLAENQLYGWCVSRSIAVILLCLVPLTGCSRPELSYDPVELIEYERCLNTIPPNFTAELWAYEGIAEEYCKEKKPSLK